MSNYPRKQYGAWAGRPNGVPYNPDQCAKEVQGSMWTFYQCTRKPGHGERGLFCKQHAKRYPATDEATGGE